MMIEMAGMTLFWQSDWNGDEVGYPETPVVGLYQDGEGTMHYIDIENEHILESWKEEEEF